MKAWQSAESLAARAQSSSSEARMGLPPAQPARLQDAALLHTSDAPALRFLFNFDNSITWHGHVSSECLSVHCTFTRLCKASKHTHSLNALRLETPRANWMTRPICRLLKIFSG